MMDFRNAAYNAFGGIDCEINHPLFGWIPFTANLSDPEPLGAAVFAAAQEVAEPYVEPVIDPAAVLAEERAGMVVSRFQARAAMLQADLLAAVEAAVAAADPMTQLAWSDATEWRRTSPTIATLGAALGLTEAQLDDLFRAAALIEA